jgi:hypothetical protein
VTNADMMGTNYDVEITLKGVGAITIRRIWFHRLSSISCEGPAGKNSHTNMMREKEHLLQLFHYSMKYLSSNMTVSLLAFRTSPTLPVELHVGQHSARATAPSKAD